MAFSRKIAPPSRPAASRLTADMAGIGMNFAVEPNPKANVEDTLLYASELGMDEGDLRVLSMLTQWFGLHHGYINADRLVRVVLSHGSERVRAFWSAMASWAEKDRRFRRLVVEEGEAPVALLPVGTEFQIGRRGEDQRFVGSRLRVPAGTLRERSSDVLSPGALARLHRGYRNRVIMGPSWRADLWTALEREPELSAAEAARRAYCSFATAWQVVQDFQLVAEATEDARVA